MYLPNLKSVASPVPEIIATGVLGFGTPNSGRGGRRRSEMVPFERALVISYRPSIVTFRRYLYAFQILSLLAPARHFFPPYL